MENAHPWQDILTPQHEDSLWELLHENSKIGPHTYAPPVEDVRRRMAEYHESLPYDGYPIIELPTSQTRLPMSLEQAILGRRSVRNLCPQPVPLRDVSTVLHCAYGITRDNAQTTYPRAFRVVPSGGALYPLELYFYGSSVTGLATGLYHYNPTKNHLRLLRKGDASETLAQALIQPELVQQCSLLIFITAVFERSIFKYGERGYRFIMLETGHVAQNINLVTVALGLGSVNIGGFLDRNVDAWLGLDGLSHGTLYLIAVGGHDPVLG